MNKKNSNFTLAGSLFNIEELAEILGISTRTLYEYAKSGILKGRKIGRSWIFTEKNVVSFLNCEQLEGEQIKSENSRI